MKRKTHKKETLPPEYVCSSCGAKAAGDKHPVRLGSTRIRYCPVCRAKTEHTRIG